MSTPESVRRRGTQRGVSFRAFVAGEVARCESLGAAPGYFFGEAAQTEICNWLEAKAGEEADAQRESTLDWVQSDAGRRVHQVVNAIMDGDYAPTLNAVRDIWRQLHDSAPAKVNYNCELCHGTGYQIVTRDGLEGAMRCPQQCAVPPNRAHATRPRSSAADAEEQTRWAKEVEAEIAAKLAKPLSRTPPAPQVISEADFEELKEQEHAADTHD